jgi:uncharacterized ferredoxin-like protein
MTRVDSEQAIKEAVKTAAALIVAAARTAPKTRGLDSVKMLVLDGEDLQELASAMEAKYRDKAYQLQPFLENAALVRNAAAVLLIGVTGEPKRPGNPLNCGACGYQTCAEFLAGDKGEGEDFRGPLCVFQAIDLGIALGSAVKMASDLNVDNRIMFTIGAAARAMGLLESDVVLGLPLSISGKNPYFAH